MFNLAVHDQLVALGYEYAAHEADYYDDGGPESGPHLEGGPPWDEYLLPDHRVIVDHDGHVALFEDRDLALEAWCDEMAGEQSDDERLKLMLGGVSRNG